MRSWHFALRAVLLLFPTLLSAQQPAAQCIDCHSKVTPNIVSDWKLSKHSSVEVTCVNCHGENGQGVQIGDKKAGPLWGPDSWNDGAGAARVYTLAGIIRYSMPYLYPGGLTDEEAQQVAAFIDSQPRPSYPFKDNDYRVEKLPVDSVYYAKRNQ